MLYYLDLHQSSCLEGNCQRLKTIIDNSSFDMEVHRYTSLSSLTNWMPPPKIIFCRPKALSELPRLAQTLREKWNHATIMGVICHRIGKPAKRGGRWIKCLDDFLTCPIQEKDFYLRFQRLLDISMGPKLSTNLNSTSHSVRIENLVGESPCFLKVIDKIPLVSCSKATVLLLGETGTGKELFARAIHYHSPQKGKPFIPVNCGALPETIFERELFGHTKGAYTDASSTQKGLIQEAEGGTLFLDEIDSLTFASQIKLLRFLENKEYRPLGSPKTLIADVRVLAASNVDLRKLVEEGKLRQDLFYRLNVLSLTLPPLSKRPEDIPLLVQHFLTRYSNSLDLQYPHLTFEALQKLMLYQWPGNVRELETVVQRAITLNPGKAIGPDCLDLSMADNTLRNFKETFKAAKTKVVAQFERSYLTSLLLQHKGNISHAAMAAGKERRAFQRMLKKHHIDRSAFLQKMS